jgi:signal transduction histidine kinase
VSASRSDTPNLVRDRWFWALVAGALAFSLFSVIWLAAHPGHDKFTVAFDDVSESVAPLAAAVLCFFASRRAHRRTRVAWTLIGMSALSWGLGQVAWTYQEVVLGKNASSLFPSWPDVGYLIAIPFGVVGLIALPALSRARAKIQLLLDGILIGGGMLFVSWAIALGPIYANSPTDLKEKIIGLAYPASDIVMATVVILVISRMSGRGRQPFAFLALGILVNAVADSAFAYFTTVQSYDTASPLNVGWTLGYCLIGLGAFRAFTLPGGVEGDTSLARWRTVLPYVPVVAAGVVAIAKKFQGAQFDDILIWDALVIICVVLIRQFVLVFDTHNLGLELQEHNTRLDDLVNKRTAALQESLEQLHEANDEGQRLLLRLVTLQDEERRRLSAVIHDDMLQGMTVGHTRLQVASKSTNDENLLAALTRADEAVQASIRSMRGLMSELHPQVVERGLTLALQEYLSQVERDFDLHCALEGGFAHEPNGTVATTIYRIICEAVVNARKHAPGAHLTVRLSDTDEGYAVAVADNGPGFVPDPTGGSPTGHVGLSSMRERAEALGGRWHIDSQPGDGTTVDLWIPHSADSLIVSAQHAGAADPVPEEPVYNASSV